MIPQKIAHHILSTIAQLPSRPILFFAGDEAQQQPIATVDGKTRPLRNILSERNFSNSVKHYRLTQQFRCIDPRLEAFLDHIRNWKPSQELLNSIQHGYVSDGVPSNHDILQTLLNHPTATVLTVSRSATNRVDDLVVKNFFQSERPLLFGKCDCDFPPIPLYKGMRMIITQNRDKIHGFVNGQEGKVVNSENQTVFLQLPNGIILNIHLVTCLDTNGYKKTVYPFAPAYASTICKAQGQTLEKAIIWFDCAKLSPGTGYVDISCVKTLDSIVFLTPMQVSHFTPATTTEMSAMQEHTF